MPFFSSGACSKNYIDFESSLAGGDPVGNLERTRGATRLVAKMLIATATGSDAKGQLLADVWEQSLEL